jgi:hypothetical protein
MPSPVQTARARRIALIRRRVVVATLATFAMAWGVIAYDGSMGTPSTTAASTKSAATTTTTGTAAASGDNGAAITTSQS